MTGNKRWPHFNEHGQTYETAASARRASKTRSMYLDEKPIFEIVEFELIETLTLPMVAKK